MVLRDLPSAYTFQNGGRKDAGKTWASRGTQAISTGGGAGSDGAADHTAGGQGAPGLCGQKCPGGSQPETGKAGGRRSASRWKRRRGVSLTLMAGGRIPFTGEKAFHRGVDLACGEGTPVLAALDGVVTAARRRSRLRQLCPADPWGRAGNALCPHAVSLCPGRGGGCSRPAAGHCRTDGPCHRGTPAL